MCETKIGMSANKTLLTRCFKMQQFRGHDFPLLQARRNIQKTNFSI